MKPPQTHTLTKKVKLYNISEKGTPPLSQNPPTNLWFVLKPEDLDAMIVREAQRRNRKPSSLLCQMQINEFTVRCDISLLQIDEHTGYMDVESYIQKQVDNAYKPSFTTPAKGDNGVLADFLRASAVSPWPNGYYENSAKLSHIAEDDCNPPEIMLTPTGQTMISTNGTIHQSILHGVLAFLDFWFSRANKLT